MPTFEALGGLRYAAAYPYEFAKHLRARTGPIRIAQRALARVDSPVTENDRALLALRGIHRGRRCFVVGNGPSLRLTDLTAICDDITIASNRIFLALGDVSWRPTYYTVTDPLYSELDRDRIARLDLVKIFPDYMRRILGRGTPQGAQGSTLFYRPLRSRFTPSGEYLGRFSADALKGFHPGRSVTVLNIQLAHYLGCNPIYLIGVDGHYRLSGEVEHRAPYGKILVSRGELNHFHEDYRAPGEPYQVPEPELVEAGLRACREYLEAEAVDLRNASRSTRVQALECVSLDELIG